MGNPYMHPSAHSPRDPAALKLPVFVVDADDRFRHEVVTHFAANGLRPEGCADAASLFRRLRQSRPGCIILDLHLPDMRGLDVQHTLAAQFSCIPLMFVAAEAHIPTVTEAIRRGACDFVLKPVNLSALLEQTRTLLEAVHRLDPGDLQRETMHRRLRTLTARESHILTLALTGKSNKEISLGLGISHRTVETHRTHILQKIGVSNLLELAHILSDIRHYAPVPQMGLAADAAPDSPN